MGLLPCACAPPPAAQPSQWWGVYFFIYWPESEEPRWHIDELLAEEVVKPVLTAEAPNLPLWRFHRRAVRDEAGHRFRFLFYAPISTAERIDAAIRRQPALADLERTGRLIRVQFVDAAGPGQSGIEATSDPRWPVELQRSWPHYIMGASRMWLDLLDQFVAKHPHRPHDEALFRDVHREITDLWTSWGRHAWLHHLEALYAYEPPCPGRESSEPPPRKDSQCPNPESAPSPKEN